MTKFIVATLLIFLLLIWLAYRETLHRRKTKEWAKKHVQNNNIPYQKAIDRLREKPKKRQSVSDAPIFQTENSLNASLPEDLQNFTLIRPGMIDEETFVLASEIVDCIKRPHSALQALTRNITPEELIDVLHGCPDITAKILTTVNSAAFGLSQPITSINHAVIYLGLSIVKSIATQFIIKQSMNSTDKNQKKAYKKLWQAAYLTSSLSFLSAQSLSKINAAELSTKALLSTIGCFAITCYKPELASLYTEEHSLIKRIEAEQSKLGLNAYIIGNLLAKKWKLPQNMIESITHSTFPLKYNKSTQAFTTEQKHDLVFCYLMCRLGEEITYQKLKRVEDLHFNELSSSEYFYLQEALEDTELTSCIKLFNNPTFVKKANQIILQSRM